MPQPKPLVPAIDPPPICFRVQVIPPNKNIRHKIYIFDSTTKVFKLKSFLSYPSSKNARNTVFLERHSGKFYTKLLKCVSSKQAVFVYSTTADSAYTLIGLVETDKPSKSGSVAAPSLIFTLCWGDGQNLYAVPSSNSIFKTLTELSRMQSQSSILDLAIRVDVFTPVTPVSAGLCKRALNITIQHQTLKMTKDSSGKWVVEKTKMQTDGSGQQESKRAKLNDTRTSDADISTDNHQTRKTIVEPSKIHLKGLPPALSAVDQVKSGSKELTEAIAKNTVTEKARIREKTPNKSNWEGTKEVKQADEMDVDDILVVMNPQALMEGNRAIKEKLVEVPLTTEVKLTESKESSDSSSSSDSDSDILTATLATVKTKGSGEKHSGGRNADALDSDASSSSSSDLSSTDSEKQHSSETKGTEENSWAANGWQFIL